MKEAGENQFEKYIEQVLNKTDCSKVLKQYNILKKIVNNNSIPNVKLVR